MTSPGDNQPARPEDIDPDEVDKVEPDLTNVYGKPLHLSRISTAMSKARQDAAEHRQAPPPVKRPAADEARPAPERPDPVTPAPIRADPVGAAPAVAPSGRFSNGHRQRRRVLPLFLGMSLVVALCLGGLWAFLGMRTSPEPGNEVQVATSQSADDVADPPPSSPSTDAAEANATKSLAPSDQQVDPAASPAPQDAPPPQLALVVEAPPYPAAPPRGEGRPATVTPPSDPAPAAAVSVPTSAPSPTAPPSFDPRTPAPNTDERPDFADGARVTVHFADGLAQPDLDTLMLALSGVGLATAPPVAVGFQISEPNIRYYHPEDRPAAEWVKSLLKGDGRLTVRDFTSFRPSPSPGLVELWLSGGFASGN